MTEYDDELLQQGILHFKANEFDAARRYFERALAAADDYSTRTRTNYYLSLMESDPKKKRDYLEEVLAINPGHAEARRELAILDGRLKPEEIINPDAPALQTTGTVAAQADRFTCPKCGGRMTYAPDGRSLVCEFCSRKQNLGDKRAQEQDFFAAMATSKGHRAPVATQIFHCQGCGAEFVLPAAEMSAVCAYCGSAHVTRQQRELSMPDSIIPMMVDQRAATQALVDWVERNRITPASKVPVPRGFYLPVWTFDLLGSIPWNGFVYRDKKRVPVSGEATMSLDSTRIAASKKLADLLPDLLPGFNFDSAVAYDPRYLAGWPAQVYEVPLADAALDAREAVVRETRAKIQHENGQVTDLSYKTTGVSISAFNLVLLPLWLTEVPVEERTLRVVINGVIGTAHGDSSKRGLTGWIANLIDGK